MFYETYKTIIITITVKNGAVIFPDDFNLSALRKEFHAELILKETDFKDKAVFHSLAQETEIEFLPGESRLLVNISLQGVPAQLSDKVITDERPHGVDGGFVEIFLLEPQHLKMRGTKKAKLLNCAVKIPSLQDEPAKSINHAYTLISQAFEPWRISHTANVFQKVYWRENDQSLLQSLDVRREQFEAQSPNVSKHTSR